MNMRNILIVFTVLIGLLIAGFILEMLPFAKGVIHDAEIKKQGRVKDSLILNK